MSEENFYKRMLQEDMEMSEENFYKRMLQEDMEMSEENFYKRMLQEDMEMSEEKLEEAKKLYQKALEEFRIGKDKNDSTYLRDACAKARLSVVEAVNSLLIKS